MGKNTTAEKAPEIESRSGHSHEAIRTQLERILIHREFHATDKMRDFLRFVVEEKLAGRANRLKGFTIATRVFARGDDFDAAQDPIVRIQAGRLRRFGATSVPGETKSGCRPSVALCPSLLF